MVDAPQGSLCVAFIGATLATVLSSGSAKAEAGVSIHYESDDQLELARRVASELATEGYAVDIDRNTEPSPCEPSGARLVTVPRGTKTWIRLRADPSNPDTIIASICYLGAQPFLQQAAPSAPRSKANELALATAEALNGLRSKLPPIEGGPERNAPDTVTAPPAERPPAPPAPSAPRAESLVNSAAVGATLMWNLPDVPAASGISARATLGLVPSLGIALEAFAPINASELASETVTARVRTTWLRVGPSFAGTLGDFELSAAALAGPALSWATAEARPPRVGTTDVTTGAVITLSAFVEYPRRSTLFAYASSAASALLPGIEVNLADTEPQPRGSFPLEASLGFGARWGATP